MLGTVLSVTYNTNSNLPYLKLNIFPTARVKLTEPSFGDIISLTLGLFSFLQCCLPYIFLCQNQVKKHRHETLSLHGAGKHLAKSEASRILRHLVIEDFLMEEVKKSDVYGSVSSVLKVLLVAPHFSALYCEK